MADFSSIDLTALAYEVLLEKGFIPDYPQPVQQEIANLQAPTLPLADVAAQELRHLLWFSVDNDDSRDLDQLTYAESLPEGKCRIYIAVADVDLLVKRHSAIDARAAQNTTSVYTPTKTFPMLPETAIDGSDVAKFRAGSPGGDL